MKKLISMVLSLAVIAGGITAATPVTSSAASILTGTQEFFDIAYSSSLGMYVAAAKDYSASANTETLYASKDRLTWTKVKTISSALISANKQSQQQLVWWAAAGVFVAHASSTTYCSSDGINWTENTTIHFSSNGSIETNGSQLVTAAGAKVKMAASLTSVSDVYTFTSTASYYAKTLGVGKPDANGNINLMINDQYYVFDVKALSANGTYSFTSGSSGSPAMQATPTDTAYSPKTGTYLTITGKSKLVSIGNASTISSFEPVASDTQITAIGVSDDFVVIGTSTGALYYTNNTAAGISASSTWTQIPNASSSTANTEAVKAIGFSDASDFVVLSKTQIYTATISSYANISDYQGIGTPTVSGKNVFNGVDLLSGTYSQSLGKYIVVGNTTAADAEGNKYGEIFTSADGLNWTMTNKTTDLFFTNHNSAVWWGAQSEFVVLATAKDNAGISFTSPDGVTWTRYAQTDTDARMYADVAVSGNNLYTTNNGRQFRKYTAWNLASMTYTPVTVASESWYMDKIAVSDDSDPAAIIAGSYYGAVRNNESTATDELSKWKAVSNLGAYGTISDVKFSANLNKFVGVQSTQGWKITVIDKTGTTASGPASNVFLNALETNGSRYMFGGADGNVYTCADDASFSSSTTLTAVPLAASGSTANTKAVTDVIKAGTTGFIATASDGTDSDVLVISADGSQYVKASDSTTLSSIKGGDEITVRAKATNNSASVMTFTMLTAVYNGTQLVQVVPSDKSVAAATSEYVSQDITLDAGVTSGAKMKVFIWNSREGMLPLKKTTAFFQ